jgi:hypothetical protein
MWSGVALFEWLQAPVRTITSMAAAVDPDTARRRDLPQVSGNVPRRINAISHFRLAWWRPDASCSASLQP